MNTTNVLELEHITKAYDDNVVLKDVSLSVRPGEIYALVGENGAGKSTLMNILFGMSVIQNTGGFEGTVKIDGEPVHFSSPNDAMHAGIGMVHQEFMLIPGFTITENIKIGREDTLPTVASMVFGKKLEKLNWQSMERDAKTALDAIGMDMDTDTRVAGLPVGYMQFIEIAREIDKTGIKLLVFDEPTAVLTETEATRLLDVMRTLSQKGIAIIFITHRLDEVMQVCDRFTILRDGEVVTEKSVAESNTVEIAELMVGRKIEKLVDDTMKPEGLEQAPIAMRIRDLRVNMPGERVAHVDLDIRQGEIMGVGGLAGQGKVGIPNGIMGLFPATGEVEIFGEKVDINKLGASLHKGVAYVSEDRRGVGLLLDESIEMNISFHAMAVNKDYLKNLGIAKLLDSKAIRKHALDMIDVLDIRCTGPQQKVGALSGGNQQKVCLANALSLSPRILMVSEPTRGIDIGAKKLIMEYLVRLRNEQGVTILMVSSELVELRSICDRIAIVNGGQITDILLPDAADAAFGLAMSTKKAKEA